jgi:hypothetical protein
MFGLGPIELAIVGVIACVLFVAPIVIIVLLIRAVAIKEKNDQRPGP